MPRVDETTEGTTSTAVLRGAVRIRADVERKRLAGLAPQQRSRSLPASGLYSAAMNDTTYARLVEAASAVLDSGWPAILDATFLRRADRDAARRRAAEVGVPFVLLHFEAAPEVLRQRLRQRAAHGQDASEADETVLAMQARTQEPLQPDETALQHTVQSASAPGQDPRVDWAPLLARLGWPAPG